MALTRWTTIVTDVSGDPAVPIESESWHDSQDDDYLKSITVRAKQERLTWCSQFFDILEKPETGLSSISFSLNDFGCQYFQVYKELISREHLSVDYFGYDSEKRYVDVGLSLFPELKSSCKVADVAREGGDIREADVSVISATLEHIDDFQGVIENLVKKSRKVVVIRSFFGGVYLKDFAKKPSAKAPYPIQQFVLDELLFPAFADWDVEVVRDHHTDSMPIVKFFENGPIVRTAYFVVLQRNPAPSPAGRPL